MKILTVLSGKGGVGKSSTTASLAILLAKQKKIIAADCDVDAADLGLVLGIKKFKEEKEISTNYKAFTNEKAKNCEQIKDICTFSAISWDDEKNMPIINEFLCEGCGACKLLCPEGIDLKRVNNAIVRETETNYGFPLVSGQLKMGESGSGNVVAEVKKIAEKNEEADIMIVDSAAGIGCPVIASIQGSDFVIAVTEPTPSALSDLKRSLQVVEHFKIPYGIIINKYDLYEEFSEKIENFMKEKNIPLLGKIPYDRDFVKALVNLKPIVVWNKKYEKVFSEILKNVQHHSKY